MSDEIKNAEAGEDSFAAMMQAMDEAGGETLRVGDLVRGKVISVGESAVYVDTGTKIDAVVDKAELVDDKDELTVKEGDEVQLYVVEMSGSQIRLSRALAGVGGLAVLQEAFEGKVPVEGRVIEACKGGYRVELLHRKVFCPASQIDLRYAEDPTVHVGQTYQFLIIKLEEGGKNVVVSRRELLGREQKESSEAFLANAKPGEIFEGVVVRLAPFGCFVRLDSGVEGMVHVSEMSWSRVDKPEDAVKIGERVQVKLLSMTPGDKGGVRVSLSMKQAQVDPWLSAAPQFKPGDKVEAKIVRLAPFGAFAEIAPGVEGLIHLSEMSFLKRINKPEEVVSAGQMVTVAVKDVDLEHKRISLSLREAEGDPWAEAPAKFAPGTAIEGTIEKKEKFGWFINLAPGITGLLPKSRLSRAENVKELDNKKPGDTVGVIVEEIDPAARKMTLGLPGGTAREDGEWKSFAPKTEKPMGLLGEKLKAALNSKK